MNSNATAIFWRAAAIGSAAGSSHGRSSVPTPNMSAPVPRERVPEADADPQVVRHPLAEDHAVGLVDPERERISAVQPAEPDRSADLGEERLAHVPLPPGAAAPRFVQR